MINTQPLTPASLETFPALSAALDAARLRLGEDEDLDVINEKEIWAAFACLDDDDVCYDAFTVCTSEVAAAVLSRMVDLDFCPNSTKHLALGVCLYAALHLRESSREVGR